MLSLEEMLYQAIKDNDIKVVDDILHDIQQHPNKIDLNFIVSPEENETFLSLAVKKGNPEIINRIMSHPTMQARQKTILDRRSGSDPLQTPIEIAALKGDFKTILILLEAGAELYISPEAKKLLPKEMYEKLNTLSAELKQLGEAVIKGDIKAATALIQKGVNVNYVSKKYGRLLPLALSAAKIDIAILLLENGYDLNNRMRRDFLVEYAATSELTYSKGQLIQLLNYFDKDLSFKYLKETSPIGESPAYFASLDNNVAFLKDLIDFLPKDQMLEIFYIKTRAGENTFMNLLKNHSNGVFDIIFSKISPDEKITLILGSNGNPSLLMTAIDKGLPHALLYLLNEIPEKERIDVFLFPNIEQSPLFALYQKEDWETLNQVLKFLKLPTLSLETQYEGQPQVLLQLSESFPDLKKLLETEEQHTERVRSSPLQELFKAGDAKALHSKFREETKKLQETIGAVRSDPLLLHGPLVKTQHTVDL